MKFNWGHGIALFLGIFVISTITAVYVITTDPSMDHELVTPNYYEEELKYQNEIDLVNNSKKLSSAIELKMENDGILVNFPGDFPSESIKGKVMMIRPSKKVLDFTKEFSNIKDYKYLISDERLVKGKWEIKIFWEANGNKYLYKSKITY